MTGGSGTTHPRIGPRRGGGGGTWWSKAVLRAVEEASFGEKELRAGRALARAGAVGSITVEDGGAGLRGIQFRLLDALGLGRVGLLEGREEGELRVLLLGLLLRRCGLGGLLPEEIRGSLRDREETSLVAFYLHNIRSLFQVDAEPLSNFPSSIELQDESSEPGRFGVIFIIGRLFLVLG